MKRCGACRADLPGAGDGMNVDKHAPACLRVRLQSRIILWGAPTYLVAAWFSLAMASPCALPPPNIGLDTDDGGHSYYVTTVEAGLRWEYTAPIGCGHRPPNGTIEVGDLVERCAGNLALDYNALGAC